MSNLSQSDSQAAKHTSYQKSALAINEKYIEDDISMMQEEVKLSKHEERHIYNLQKTQQSTPTSNLMDGAPVVSNIEGRDLIPVKQKGLTSSILFPPPPKTNKLKDLLKRRKKSDNSGGLSDHSDPFKHLAFDSDHGKSSFVEFEEIPAGGKEGKGNKYFQKLKQRVKRINHNSEGSFQIKQEWKPITEEQLDSILCDPVHHLFTRLQQSQIYNYCTRVTDLTTKQRKEIWVRATGALNQQKFKSSQNYYSSLKQANLNYPNPHFHQIELDLKRTFQEESDPKKVEERIGPLRNVLATYTKRNPTVGYCQGMNFIVGRLLRYLEEEEAFWVLTMLVETILPLDYYSNMVGVLIDQKVFMILLRDRLPELYEHLERCNFDPSLMAFQWFVCFFTYNLQQDVHKIYDKYQTSLKVWDLFMLKGVKVLFNVAISIMYLIRKQLFDTEDFGSLFAAMEKAPKEEIDPDSLLAALSLPKLHVKTKEILKIRLGARAQVIHELQTMVDQKENQGSPYPKINFVNKFFLYSGLGKQLNDDMGQKTLETYEKELMEAFNCDPSWPICLFDFSYKNKLPNFFCFKIERPLNKCIIENYFEEQSLPIIKKAQNQQGPAKELVAARELMLERSAHYCQCHSLFLQNFKLLFNLGHELLLSSKCLQFNIEDENEIIEKMDQFQQQVIKFKDRAKSFNIANTAAEQEEDFYKERRTDLKSGSYEVTSFGQELRDSNINWLQENRQTQSVRSLEKQNEEQKCGSTSEVNSSIIKYSQIYVSVVSSLMRKTTSLNMDFVKNQQSNAVLQDYFSVIEPATASPKPNKLLHEDHVPVAIQEVQDKFEANSE